MFSEKQKTALDARYADTFHWKQNNFGFLSTMIINIPKGKFPEAIPLLNHLL